jgi:acyl carrier protein
MDIAEALKQINDIFIDVLDDDSIVLSENSSAKDIEDWDSLTHIQIVFAIEKKFKLKFTTSEIQKWTKVGDMINSIIKKINGAA